MASTYTYNPSDIVGSTVSRARFELGDILVDGGETTCMLCDEEIQAVIGAYPRWKTALYRLADAVCMRLSYETDWRDDNTAFNLNQRAERWWKLRDQLKKEAEAAENVPQCAFTRDTVRDPNDHGHYFYGGMLNNDLVQPPYPFPGGER